MLVPAVTSEPRRQGERVKAGPITGWEQGQIVRTLTPVHNRSKPWLLPAGVLGRLLRLQRVQDGVEMWTCYVPEVENWGIWGVTNRLVEGCYGPTVYPGADPVAWVLAVRA